MRTITLQDSAEKNLNELKRHLERAEGRAQVAYDKYTDYLVAMEYMDDCDALVYDHKDYLWSVFGEARDEVKSIKEDMLRVYLHCDA